MTKLYKVEREYTKIIKNCYFHADWAGSDLQRWDRVFAEYEKSPKKLKILNMLIDKANSKYLMIMVENNKMQEIEKRCAENSFLIREFTILRNEIERYFTKHTEESVEDQIARRNQHVIDFKM